MLIMWLINLVWKRLCRPLDLPLLFVLVSSLNRQAWTIRSIQVTGIPMQLLILLIYQSILLYTVDCVLYI